MLRAIAARMPLGDALLVVVERAARSAGQHGLLSLHMHVTLGAPPAGEAFGAAPMRADGCEPMHAG